MFSRLARVLRRGPGDWLRFAQAWWILLAADLGLRRLPFPRVERLLAPGTGIRPAARGDAAARCLWAVSAAARHHLWAMTCLPRALSLRWLLGRQGIAAELRIGVAREDGRLLAHAWVELDGRPFGDYDVHLSSFQPLEEVTLARIASRTRDSRSRPFG